MKTVLLLSLSLLAAANPIYQDLSSPVPRSLLQLRDKDPCVALGTDGKPRTDCQTKNKLNSKGECPVSVRSPHCQTYCEESRAGLVGKEETLDGVRAIQGLPHQKISLTDQVQTTFAQGFDIGLEGTLKEIIGAGVSYTFSVEVAKITGEQIDGEDDPPHNTRWVFFPSLVKTCGTTSESSLAYSPCGSMCGVQEYCGNKITSTKHNVCATSPMIGDKGITRGIFVQRYEDPHGVPLKLDEQPEAYKSFCLSGDTPGDPDNDGEIECKAAL